MLSFFEVGTISAMLGMMAAYDRLPPFGRMCLLNLKLTLLQGIRSLRRCQLIPKLAYKLHLSAAKCTCIQLLRAKLTLQSLDLGCECRGLGSLSRSSLPPQIQLVGRLPFQLEP